MLYNSINSQVVPIRSRNSNKIEHELITVEDGETKESDVINVHSNKSFGTVIFEFTKTGGSPSCVIYIKYRMRGSSNWGDAITLKASFSISSTKVVPLRLDAVLMENWLPNTEMIYVFTASGGNFTVKGEHGV